jgi:thiol-disulfide isomerase/thioredoxin
MFRLLFVAPRRLVAILALSLTTVLASGLSGVQALELIMFDASWCGYCRQFKMEVFPIYSQTALGSKIPLEIVDLSDQDRVWFDLDERIEGVPTFVLVSDGSEVARFSGYSGPRAFFATLAQHAEPHLDN